MRHFPQHLAGYCWVLGTGEAGARVRATADCRVSVLFPRICLFTSQLSPRAEGFSLHLCGVTKWARAGISGCVPALIAVCSVDHQVINSASSHV